MGREFMWNEPNPWELGGQGGQAGMLPSAANVPMTINRDQSEGRLNLQPQAQPSFMDQLQARFANPMTQQGLGLFLAASQGKDLNAGLNSGMDRAKSWGDQMRQQAEEKRQAIARQAIQQFLQNGQGMQGIPPALQEIARATGDAGPIGQYIMKTATGGQTDDIKEFEYAKKAGFEGSFQQWMEKKKALGGEYNKVPVYGTRVGPDGQAETVMLQTGSRGDAVATKLPDGVSVHAQKPIQLDAGTHTVLLDPITRQQIGVVPKQVAETNRQKAVGTGQGEAQVHLPTVESNADATIGYIDKVLGDPNLDTVLGDIGGRTPNVSTAARTVQSKIDQLKGRAFLEAFASLKGAGAITETEGAKATQALTRLTDQVQSGKDYREALQDFKAEVNRLRELARRKAGVGGPNGNAGIGDNPARPQNAGKRLRYNPQTGELE